MNVIAGIAAQGTATTRRTRVLAEPARGLMALCAA
jgi:hypothetical protein